MADELRLDVTADVDGVLSAFEKISARAKELQKELTNLKVNVTETKGGTTSATGTRVPSTAGGAVGAGISSAQISAMLRNPLRMNAPLLTSAIGILTATLLANTAAVKVATSNYSKRTEDLSRKFMSNDAFNIGKKTVEGRRQIRSAGFDFINKNKINSIKDEFGIEMLGKEDKPRGIKNFFRRGVYLQDFGNGVDSMSSEASPFTKMAAPLARLTAGATAIGALGIAFAALGGVLALVQAGVNAAVTGIKTLVSTFFELAKTGVKTYGNFERIQLSFEAFGMTAKDAKKLFKEIKDFATTSVMDFEDLAQITPQLMAAQIPVMKSLRAISNIAAPFGKEKIQELGDAFVRARGERNFGRVMQTLGSMGINAKDFNKQGINFDDRGRMLFKGGEGKFEQMFDALMKIAKEKFGKVGPMLESSLQVALSNLHDMWIQFWADFGEGFAPFLKLLSLKIKNVLKFLQGENFTGGLGKGLSDVIGKFMFGVKPSDLFPSEKNTPVPTLSGEMTSRGFVAAAGSTSNIPTFGMGNPIAEVGKKDALTAAVEAPPVGFFATILDLGFALVATFEALPDLFSTLVVSFDATKAIWIEILAILKEIAVVIYEKFGKTLPKTAGYMGAVYNAQKLSSSVNPLDPRFMWKTLTLQQNSKEDAKAAAGLWNSLKMMTGASDPIKERIDKVNKNNEDKRKQLDKDRAAKGDKPILTLEGIGAQIAKRRAQLMGSFLNFKNTPVSAAEIEDAAAAEAIRQTSVLKKIEENTQPLQDFTQFALGGGDIGKIGITAVERYGRQRQGSGRFGHIAGGGRDLASAIEAALMKIVEQNYAQEAY